MQKTPARSPGKMLREDCIAFDSNVLVFFLEMERAKGNEPSKGKELKA
jgi:hypothetical protein